MRRMRIVLSVLVAIAALSGVGAAAASALNVEPAKTAYTEESTNLKMVAPNKGSVECAKTLLTGKTPNTLGETKAPIGLTFENCKAFGATASVGLSCSASIEGSWLSLLSVTASISAECSILVTLSSCKVSVAGPQTISGAWANGVQGERLSTATFNKSEAKFTSTGGICGASGAGTISGAFNVFQTESPKNTVILK